MNILLVVFVIIVLVALIWTLSLEASQDREDFQLEEQFRDHSERTRTTIKSSEEVLDNGWNTLKESISKLKNPPYNKGIDPYSDGPIYDVEAEEVVAIKPKRKYVKKTKAINKAEL